MISFFLHHFVLAKLATSSMRANPEHPRIHVPARRRSHILHLGVWGSRALLGSYLIGPAPCLVSLTRGHVVRVFLALALFVLIWKNNKWSRRKCGDRDCVMFGHVRRANDLSNSNLLAFSRYLRQNLET